jgi:large subunit ribosomal protein L19e
MHIMAKQTVNKSALVRDYLAKYPEKGPTAIAQQINQEKGVKISGKFVTSVKTKLKQASGSAAAVSIPAPAAVTPAKKKPAPATLKATPAKPASAPARAAALSQHIANLKAAAQRLGKDEAKRIIDLF